MNWIELKKKEENIMHFFSYFKMQPQDNYNKCVVKNNFNSVFFSYSTLFFFVCTWPEEEEKSRYKSTALIKITCISFVSGIHFFCFSFSSFNFLLLFILIVQCSVQPKKETAGQQFLSDCNRIHSLQFQGNKYDLCVLFIIFLFFFFFFGYSFFAASSQGRILKLLVSYFW